LANYSYHQWPQGEFSPFVHFSAIWPAIISQEA